jgi:hypothetical protein
MNEEPVSAVVDDEAPRRGGPSGRQVFLGLFILGQLAFLILANLCGMLDHYGRRGFPGRFQTPVDQAAPDANRGRGHFWKLNESVYTLAWYWGQLTGQPQNWSLFAPNVGVDCYFPALAIRWELPMDSPAMLARPVQLFAAGPAPAASLHAAAVAILLQDQPWSEGPADRLVRRLAPLVAMEPLTLGPLFAASNHALTMAFEREVLLSDNEPRDVDDYLRIGRFRLRRLEGVLLPYLPHQDTWEKTAQHWRGEIESHVRRYGAFIETYCRFRLQTDPRYRDGPLPAQMILVLRRYRIQPPQEEGGRRWTGPQVLPIARWQPHRERDKPTRPIEWYNPETERFEAIAK